MSTHRIPRHAFIDDESYFAHLYKPRKSGNPLYQQLAKAFHDALPDEVANCLTDELMNAEARGELEAFRLEAHIAPVVDTFIAVLKKLAVPLEDGELGCSVMAVTIPDLSLLKNEDAMRQIISKMR